MREDLRRVLAEVFQISPADIPYEASIDTLDGWDSLRHLELMLALELEFGVHLNADTMLELQSTEAIEAFLSEAGA